jgi:predicted DsbA family dithiol-disulfide isomerase
MKLIPQLQMIAKESGLLAIAQSKGVTAAQANACLAATPMHKTVIAMTKDAVEVRKINSTPTFLINNKPGPKSSEWADMDTALRASLGLR